MTIPELPLNFDVASIRNAFGTAEQGQASRSGLSHGRRRHARRPAGRPSRGPGGAVAETAPRRDCRRPLARTARAGSAGRPCHQDGVWTVPDRLDHAGNPDWRGNERIGGDSRSRAGDRRSHQRRRRPPAGGRHIRFCPRDLGTFRSGMRPGGRSWHWVGYRAGRGDPGEWRPRP